MKTTCYNLLKSLLFRKTFLHSLFGFGKLVLVFRNSSYSLLIQVRMQWAYLLVLQQNHSLECTPSTLKTVCISLFIQIYYNSLSLYHFIFSLGKKRNLKINYIWIPNSTYILCLMFYYCLLADDSRVTNKNKKWKFQNQWPKQSNNHSPLATTSFCQWNIFWSTAKTGNTWESLSACFHDFFFQVQFISNTLCPQHTFQPLWVTLVNIFLV